MRKGVLEYCILVILSKREAYASSIIEELKKANMIVVEGTLYPMLIRQKNQGLLSYRWEESPQGPPRKYYVITEKGRAQFVMTVTNQDTGAPLSKPGWYLDGNIHAGEVTSSMAALHLIDTLLTGYESDEMLRRIVDRYAVYVIPRVSPDGAEVYLHSPAHLRSVDRANAPEVGGLFHFLFKDGVSEVPLTRRGTSSSSTPRACGSPAIRTRTTCSRKSRTGIWTSTATFPSAGFQLPGSPARGTIPCRTPSARPWRTL